MGLPPKPKSPDEAPASPTRIVKAFGTWRVADLSEEAIDQYIKARQDAGARPATINRETQLLGQGSGSCPAGK